MAIVMAAIGIYDVGGGFSSGSHSLCCWRLAGRLLLDLFVLPVGDAQRWEFEEGPSLMWDSASWNDTVALVGVRAQAASSWACTDPLSSTSVAQQVRGQ